MTGGRTGLRPDEMRVPPWTGLAAWLLEIDRQQRMMRASQKLYRRYDATARSLTAARIRREIDLAVMVELQGRLDRARRPSPDLHGLERVWSRSELGILLVEATNRAAQLRIGRLRPRPKGPTFDPDLLPDDRLLFLIQHHHDLAVVEMLRGERARRSALSQGG